MKLSLLAIAAENHVIPQKIFAGVRAYWADLTAQKTVIISAESYEEWKETFPSAHIVKVLQD